jgi:hypothetical protein
MRRARAVVLLAALAAGSAAPRALAQDRAITFGDVLRLVQERGWRTDFHGLCREIDLPELADKCVFRQLSIQDDRERGYPRGVNVAESATDGTVVFLFHLNPLLGEFYIVSPDGALLRAYTRAHGRGYERIPNEIVSAEFSADIAYWIANFERLKRGIGVAEQPGP